jgi:hypothetical protein
LRLPTLVVVFAHDHTTKPPVKKFSSSSLDGFGGTKWKAFFFLALGGGVGQLASFFSVRGGKVNLSFWFGRRSVRLERWVHFSLRFGEPASVLATLGSFRARRVKTNRLKKSSLSCDVAKHQRVTPVRTFLPSTRLRKFEKRAPQGFCSFWRIVGDKGCFVWGDSVAWRNEFFGVGFSFFSFAGIWFLFVSGGNSRGGEGLGVGWAGEERVLRQGITLSCRWPSLEQSLNRFSLLQSSTNKNARSRCFGRKPAHRS